MRDADVIIVGAGLTGLRAAHEVSRAGLSVLVFESSDRVGGRMRTDLLDGYRLDHGFQVILTAYPELKKISGFGALGCQSFASGARVRVDGAFVEFADPLRHPEALYSLLRFPLARLGDLWRLFVLTRLSALSQCLPELRSTESALNELGFSKDFQRGFLRPFLRGVLLDGSLNADMGISRFYLQMFARGDAALPSAGIQGLPNLVADQVGQSHIRLRSAVNAVSSHEVVLENGDTYSAKHVVCAVDALHASQLGSPEQTFQHSSSATLYFSAPEPPFDDRLVVVSAEEGPIATLAVVSNVQPSYAPAGRSLVSVSVVGSEALGDLTSLRERVIAQATQWYGNTVTSWSHLKTFQIPAAVVTRPRLARGWIESHGVFYAGDYLSYGSQNGAMLAGRSLGETLAERLL